MKNLLQITLLLSAFASASLNLNAAPLIFIDDSSIGFSGDINYFGKFDSQNPGTNAPFGESITTVTTTTSFNFQTFQEEAVTTLTFADNKDFSDVGGLNFEDSQNIGVSNTQGTFTSLGLGDSSITDVQFHNFQFDEFTPASPLWEAWVNKGVTDSAGRSLETHVQFNFTQLDKIDRDDDSLELHGKGTLVYDLSDVANGYFDDGSVTATWSYTSQAGFTFSTGTIVDESITFTSGGGNAVPEPSTYAMFGTAFLILGALSYRKRCAA